MAFVSSPFHKFKLIDYRVLPIRSITCSVIFLCFVNVVPIPVAGRSKARFCFRSRAGIVGSNSAGGDGCLSLVNVSALSG